ncbi:uncharacterized protein LOC143203005 isoform X1 [Rhynchophorus ferrugineus]|uniref:uncharacterized protein LOC143203005 isoform X1 n=2 Tax=Rhynchophorus ferrugineus TaxID=354439 RepID=UPI003FCCDE3B
MSKIIERLWVKLKQRKCISFMAIKGEEYLQYLEHKYRTLSYQDSVAHSVRDFENNLEKLLSRILRKITRAVIKRNESRILDDGKFKKWNKLLWIEIVKVKDLVPIEYVQKYIRKVLSPQNLDEITEVIENNLNSCLKEKIICRLKKNRGNTQNKLKINEDIKQEWNRLREKVPLHALVIYALKVQKSNSRKSSVK